MKIKKLICIGILGIFCAVSAVGCGKKENTKTTTEASSEEDTQEASTQVFAMDTYMNLKAYGKNAQKAVDDAKSEIERLDQLWSAVDKNSEIYQLNQKKKMKVSDETLELIEFAKKKSAQSGDAFDISVYPIVELWGFPTQKYRVPSDSEIQSLLKNVDCQKIKINKKTNVVKLEKNMKIDLGGIAKGYIADQLKAYLKEQNVSHALINLGGNVLALDGKPDGSDYNIGIQKPFAQNGEAITSVKIKDQSVVSSGIYERYFKVGDKIYHHILDPKTGYPYKNNLLGVSIVCDSSTEADALSTTCFAMGLDDGLKYIEGIKGAEALFITDDYEIHYSSGFPK